MTNLKYNITNDDLKLCWKFSVEYFLNPKKDVYDRVAFKKRGLGGIADSFFQKLLEIGVCKIIQKHGNLISPLADFKIHDVGETEGDNRTEPDIIRVFRKGYGPETYEKLNTSIMNGKKNLKILNEKLNKLKKTRKNIKLIKDCANKSEIAKTKKEKTSLTSQIKNHEFKILQIKSQIQSSEQQLGLWKKETYPKVYVEIKNTAKKDAWIGPKLEEVDSIISRNKFKKSDIYYVYSRIVSNGKWDSDEEKNAERRSDPLGVFFKSIFKKNSTLKNFHDVGNLQVELQNVMTVDDIHNHGTKFPRGTIIPNPNIITIPGQKVDKFGHKDPIPFSEKKVLLLSSLSIVFFSE